MHDPELPADAAKAPGAPALPTPRLRITLALGGLLLAAAAFTFWLRIDRTSPALDETDDDIERALTVVNPGYVGMATCAECHAARAEAFQTSRHYLACRPATDAAAPGFAPGRGVHDSAHPGLRFEMTRSGNDLLAVGIQAKDEKRVSYPIGLVYGAAGKRDEMYFSWQEDRLYHLPVAWLYPFQRWGNAVNTIHARETPPSCLECHNTWVAHVPGSANQYRRADMILGVTCERCHGPGRDHVEHHRQHPQAAAHAIVHPGNLSRERLMDVCAQCHANPRPFGRPFSYRPGEPFDNYFHNVEPKYPEEDTTNQVRYLTASKCYQQSEMTCITCHDPHRPRSAQRSCFKCHTAAACTDQPRLPEAVRGDCVGCHMPPRIWMHVHFYTTSDDHYLPIAPRVDHRIGVYPEAKQTILLAWLRTQTDVQSRGEAARLTAELTGHWLKEADARRDAGRLKASIGAFREALQIDPSPAIRKRMHEVITRQHELDDLVQAAGSVDRNRPDEAEPLFLKMLQYKPDFAYAHGQLGTIYAVMGRREEALKHLQAVVQGDPNDSYGVTMLASMAFLEGRLDEAVALCAQADKIEPGHIRNHYVWGLALWKQDRWQEAAKQFRNTLANNPTHGGANQGLSEALRRQGDAAEAVRFARRALRWSDPDNVEVLVTLADAYAAAQRLVEARNTLERALGFAETTNPPLAATIRDRLRGLE